MRTPHRKGSEPNSLEILVSDINIKSQVVMDNHIIYDGVLIKFGMYDLEDVLIQMLEEYGEEELITRIIKLRL